MANATKPTAAILFQLSVVLVFFLAVCMARSIVDHESAIGDQVKPTEVTTTELPSFPPSEQPVDNNPPTACSETYHVKKGETCYSTWTRFKLPEKAFYALNPLIDCDNLDIGQALCVDGILI